MSDSAHKVASNWEARIFIEGVGEAERRLEITPEVAGWEYLSFRTYTFRAGQVIDGESASDEMCMVLLSGSVAMEVAGEGFREVWELARPGGVFDDPPCAVYLPPDHTYTMTVHEDADCAYGRAPAVGTKAPRLIAAGYGLDRTGMIQEGHDRYQLLHVVLAPGEAERLTCVETITPEGGWAHWPEERHRALDRVVASLTNEVNYYRVDEEGGYGLQRLGTHDPDRDDVVIVGHGDAVMVRHGSTRWPRRRPRGCGRFPSGRGRRRRPRRTWRQRPAHSKAEAAALDQDWAAGQQYRPGRSRFGRIVRSRRQTWE